jgi:hypothetical protein
LLESKPFIPQGAAECKRAGEKCGLADSSCCQIMALF